MNELVAKYKHLLVASESLHALDKTLTLVERATGLQIRAHGTGIAITENARWSPQDRSWKRLSGLFQETGARGTERATQSRPQRRSQPQDRSRILRTKWCLGALPSRLSVDHVSGSQYSFVFDSLLLLFHQAYFVLLPRIERLGWAAERKNLISTFFTFAEFVSDVAERFRVMGLTYEAQGDAVNALTSFDRALKATHVDEHVFMTRLQTFWMALLDKGDLRVALDLLLGIMPMVPLKHLPELRELISATFEECGGVCAEGRAAG